MELKKYKQEYNREYYANKGWYKRWMQDTYGYKDLKVEPTENNFIGTDQDEPRVCAEFGCPRHLTNEERLYGDKCIHHQKKNKIDVAKYISLPIKKSA